MRWIGPRAHALSSARRSDDRHRLAEIEAHCEGRAYETDDDQWLLAFYEQNELRYVEAGNEADVGVITAAGRAACIDVERATMEKSRDILLPDRHAASAYKRQARSGAARRGTPDRLACSPMRRANQVPVWLGGLL